MRRSRSSSRERRCRRLSRSRDRHRRSTSRDRENSPKRSSSRYHHRRRRRSRSFSSGPPRYRRRNSSDKESEKETTPPPQLLDGDKMIADTLATIALTRLKSNDQRSSSKRKRSRWVGTEHDKIFIPGMPTTLPANLNKHQEQAYLFQLQIEELSRRLRTGDLGIPAIPEERSPSPEPIYSSDGKRLNTREFRTRKRLEEERHALVLKMQKINPDFKPPGDYKPPVIKVTDYVRIPQDEYPEINFVGLLIGPRGNTLKLMEKETGAKIIIRGKGSVKEGKVGRKDGQPLPGEDEPLHAYITANNPESVKTAMEKVREIIKQGIETPEDQNNLRRMQLRELALLNGTLRENNSLRCMNCGATEHKTWMCQDKTNLISAIVCASCGAAGHIARDCLQKSNDSSGISATDGAANCKLPKIDEEYMSLMAELAGESNSETKPKPNKNVPTWKSFIQPSTTPQPLPPPPTFKDMPIITDPLPIASGSKSPTWPSGDHLVNIPWPSTSTNPIPYLQHPVPPPTTLPLPVCSWNLALDPRIATEGTTLPLWPQYQPFTTWHLPPPPGVDATVAGILSVPPPPPPK